MQERALQWIIAGLRRTWLVTSVAVTVCSVFAVRTAIALTAPPPVDLLPRSVPLHKVQAAPVVKRDGAELVVRNMFCSMCTPSHGPGSALSWRPEAILIATSIGADTRATLRVPANEVQGSFGLGDAVPGVGTIDRIGFVSIDLTAPDGRHATLSLLTGGPQDAGAATPAPVTASPSDDRIKKIDDRTFEVERSLVRELVGGSGAAAGAQISPIVKSGQLTGLRLIGVRDGKLASSLGLKNGDVLQAVNGTKIESANTLLELYAQLSSLNVVELSGTRGGKPLTVTLRLR